MLYIHIIYVTENMQYKYEFMYKISFYFTKVHIITVYNMYNCIYFTIELFIYLFQTLRAEPNYITKFCIIAMIFINIGD